MGDHVQSGVAACFSIDEYDRDLIKKHEKTRPDKEDDRTRHMLAIGAQTGPVFLTYRASIGGGCRGRRGHDRRAALRPRRARRRSSPGVAGAGRDEPVDRRCLRRARQPVHCRRPPPRGQRGPDKKCLAGEIGVICVICGSESRHLRISEYESVLAVAFPDNQMQVLPYNRVVRDLHGLTADRVPGVAEAAADRDRRRPANAGSQGRGGDVSWPAPGTRSRCRRRRMRSTSTSWRSTILEAGAGHLRRAHRQAD